MREGLFRPFRAFSGPPRAPKGLEALRLAPGAPWERPVALCLIEAVRPGLTSSLQKAGATRGQNDQAIAELTAACRKLAP